MEVPLGYLLKSFRSALAPGGWKIAVFLAILGGLVLLVLAGYLIRSSRERQHRRILADRLYQRRVAEANLAPEDERLLESLVARLDRPLEQKHHLLANPGLFHKAATRALGDGAVSPEAVAALRIRLGLAHGDAGGFLRSSSEVREQQEVRMAPEGGEALPARVIAKTPHALVVEAEEEAGRLPEVGSRLAVALTTEAGSFHFVSEVLERSGRILSLAHSERVEHEQARRFYRKGMDTQAVVRDVKTGTIFRARLLDLSGGGASLEIPSAGPPLVPGQELELRLDLPGGKPLPAPARVARLTEDGTRAHLEFHDLSVRSQDRIVEYVLG